MIQPISFQSVVDKLIEGVLILETHLSLLREHTLSLVSLELSLQAEVLKVELASLQDVNDYRPA